MTEQIDLFKSTSSVHYYAKLINGKFVDILTGDSLPLKDGATAKITVDKIYLSDNSILKSKEVRVVCNINDELQFRLYGTGLIFTVQLLEDLKFFAKASKIAVASPCKILVKSLYDETTKKEVTTFDSFGVNTLNQAYFQSSIKYKPGAKSHSINVYQHFYLKGKPSHTLEAFRFGHK